MKRFTGIFLALTALAVASFLGTAFSQGQSEVANQHKIVHRLRGDNDEEKNKDQHPPEAGKAKPQRETARPQRLDCEQDKRKRKPGP